MNQHLLEKVNHINFTGMVDTVLDVEELLTPQGNKFYRQGFLLREVQGKYPQTIFLYFYSQKYKDQLAPKNGEVVCAEISVSTAISRGKYYNNLKCWRYNYVKKEV